MLAGPVAVQPVAAKSYTLKYSDIGPPRGPRAKALMWWADELNKRSNGDLTIKFFWGQSLVKGKETLKAVGAGLSQMGTILGIYTPADLPIWNYANAPFAGTDIWVGMRTWHEMRKTVPELEAKTIKKKIKILFNNSAGPVQLLSAKVPITSVAQLKGKKIRATGGWVQLFKALGAVPVKIGFGELYAALDRGTVDGTINYIPYVKSYKHYEVASHLTIVNMGQVLGYGGGINLKLFNSMAKNLQDILVNTSSEYIDVYAKNYIDDTVTATREMQAGIDGKKVVFHYLPKSERDLWASKAGAFTTAWIAKMEKKGVNAKKIVSVFRATRAKYQQELKSKGYPWTR